LFSVGVEVLEVANCFPLVTHCGAQPNLFRFWPGRA
jgi:hypothetical protein